MMIDLSVGELSLLIEALSKAAARHESEGRFRPRRAGIHDRTAAHMRDLRDKLIRKRPSRRTTSEEVIRAWVESGKR